MKGTKLIEPYMNFVGTLELEAATFILVFRSSTSNLGNSYLVLPGSNFKSEVDFPRIVAVLIFSLAIRDGWRLNRYN